MQQLQKIKFLLGLVLVFTITFAGMCGGNKDSKSRTLAKATDDFAEGQKSAAKLLATARDNGTISQEDINEIRPFLLQANDLNAEAIQYGRKLLTTPDDQELKNQLVNAINSISATLVRANNAGLLRIKNQELRASFSAVIVTLQAAVTSAIVVLRN